MNVKLKRETKTEKKPQAPSPRRARSGLRVQSGLRAGWWGGLAIPSSGEADGKDLPGGRPFTGAR